MQPPLGIRLPSQLPRRAGEILLLSATMAILVPQGRPELAPLDIALVVGFLILSLGIHEAAHAFVAWRCGDSTAKDLGRMTLNPIVHVDLWMTIIIPASLALAGAPIFGGAKPVPVNYHRLRHPPRDMALVALAGPASNFLIAIVFAIAYKLCLSSGRFEPDEPVMLVLFYSLFANVALAVFNLLPIPPLDGSRVMAWLLPSSMRPQYVALDRYGILIVVVAIYFIPPVRTALIAMQLQAWNLIDGLTGAFG